jgi:hypothetical protein
MTSADRQQANEDFVTSFLQLQRLPLPRALQIGLETAGALESYQNWRLAEPFLEDLGEGLSTKGR